MTRYLVHLRSDFDRARAVGLIRQAPVGSRVEIKAAKRSLPQNEKLWACLSDIARQKEHFGRKYTPEVWKALFMHGWQREVTMTPSLSGREVVPLTRTSDLSKQELSDLLEFIHAWAAENGVVLHDGAEVAA